MRFLLRRALTLLLFTLLLVSTAWLPAQQRYTYRLLPGPGGLKVNEAGIVNWSNATKFAFDINNHNVTANGGYRGFPSQAGGIYVPLYASVDQFAPLPRRAMGGVGINDANTVVGLWGLETFSGWGNNFPQPFSFESNIYFGIENDYLDVKGMAAAYYDNDVRLYGTLGGLVLSNGVHQIQDMAFDLNNSSQYAVGYSRDVAFQRHACWWNYIPTAHPLGTLPPDPLSQPRPLDLMPVARYGETDSVAFANNDSEWAVGVATFPGSFASGGSSHAYAWYPPLGTAFDLGTLPGYTTSVAYDLNNNAPPGYPGDIVGTAGYGRAVIWPASGGGPIDLNTLLDPPPSPAGVPLLNIATGISTSGYIVAQSGSGTNTAYYLLTPERPPH